MATANIKAVITAEDKASSTLKGFGGTVNDVAKKAAVGLTVAGAALTYFAKNATDFTVDYVKGAKDISRETGISITEASRLTYVTQRLGISTEEASQVFGIFSKNVARSNEAFAKIGVSIKDNNGVQKTFNQLLLETADKFQAMPDGIDKTAMAMELFGRSGKDLIPFLNQGSVGIGELQTQADKLGVTLNDKTIAGVTRLIESQKLLKTSTDSLKLAVGEATAPVLTAFNTKISEVLQNLLNSDPATRNLTASILAFGGPVLTATGALVGFAANITTVIANLFAMRAATAATTTEVGVLRAAVAVPMVMPAIAVAAALAALGLVIAKAIETRNVVEESKNHIMNNLRTTEAAMRDMATMAAMGNARAQKYFTSQGVRSVPVQGTPGFASGTDFAPGGMAMVGEKGPELVNLPRGSRVTPNDKLGGNVTINIRAGAFMGSQQEARKYAQMIMNAWNDLQSSRSMA